MSLDFTQDYSNHNLLDNIHKYTKVYKLQPVNADDVVKGDTVLLKTSCGEYGVFIATEDSTETTMHLSKLIEFEFSKA